MRDAGIDVLDFHKMTKPEEVVAKKYFSELRPLLSPRVVDGACRARRAVLQQPAALSLRPVSGA